jgi:nucleoside-diphosphate kinase
MERTLVLVKPDGVKRRLIGELVTRFERAGLKVVGMKMIQADEKLALAHYTEDIAVRRGERVRQLLVDYLLEAPVVAMVLEGVESIANVRRLVGSTFSAEAAPGTIRGDYAHSSKAYADEKDIAIRNLIHASGNQEDAALVIPIWFQDGELCNYQAATDPEFF